MNPPSLDFLKGSLTAICLHALYSLYQLFQAPSVASIRARNTKPVEHAGDDDKVTVFGFYPHAEHKLWKKGVTDASPFASRVEAYLRLIKQPYVKVQDISIRNNPRGKVPYANVMGCMVDDSEVIIKTIKSTFNVTIDDDLTEQQKTTGLLVRRLLIGSLFWVYYNDRYNTERGRQDFVNDVKEKLGLPYFTTVLLCLKAFRHNMDNLEGFGISKQNPTVVDGIGKEDLQALASILGDQKYILGTQTPTSYDCDVYAFLALFLNDDVFLQNEWLQEVKKENPKLDEYVERMRDLLYPELASL